MLSRRHLRSKALQALYAYFQSDNKNIAAGEKELFHSIEKVFDLFLYELSLLIELSDYARMKIEEAKTKRLPSFEDLNPKTNFVDNKVLNALKNSSSFNKALNERKINWVNEQDFIRKMYQNIKDTPEYIEYNNIADSTLSSDQEFLTKIYKRHIVESEDLESYFEEKSIYWSDDWELVNSMIVRTIKAFTENNLNAYSLMPLYKDEKDDKDFVVNLFRKTIANSTDYENIIADKTKNWDVERIAMLDILIMKMAMAEVLNFSSIPVKVTLNEYIDISKRFSTPKSKIFVNGVLDKIILELKENNKIKKIGRGLIE